MNILKTIWKVYQSELYYKWVLQGITWFSILLWKAGSSVAVYSVTRTWTWASEAEKKIIWTNRLLARRVIW